MKKIFSRFILIFLVFFLAIYFSYPFVLDQMAKYLIVSDKLEKADVIVVLGGDGNGERVAEGVKLFKQGYAPKILMSGGPVLWHLTSADWMKKQAVEEGVALKNILLEKRSMSTLDNARLSLPILKKIGAKRVIIVTSPTHTKRAAAVFRWIYRSEGIIVIIDAVKNSEFNPKRWWTRHSDAQVVLWEYGSRIMNLLKAF